MPHANAFDADHEALAAAVVDGIIPTFADVRDDDASPVPLPLDAATEREAYAALIAMISEHKDPGTEATYLNLDVYTNGLS